VNMKDVIALARATGLKTAFLAGGAVVTRTWAESIGASFAKDGVAAVKLVEQMLSGQTQEK